MSVSSGEQLRVLLVKPYQRALLRIAFGAGPALFGLDVAADVRPGGVDVRLLDLMPDLARYFEARDVLRNFCPHVVGVSALNWKAEESGRLALMIPISSSFAQPAIGSNR